MVQVTDVTVYYEKNEKNQKSEPAEPALSGVSFSLGAGGRLALMGANGAGKSTLLLTLIGVLLPATGEITVAGIPVRPSRLRDLRQQAGMVFQNPDDQLFMPTVAEDVGFGLRNYGVAEAEARARVDRTLSRLGIGHLKHRFSHRLSGGEKRLAALAGVLVMEPSFLLLDEPSSFLDPKARRTLTAVLAGLPQAMLLATHDTDTARALCPDTLILKNGRVFACGHTADILTDAALLAEAGL
ncbi:MAG: energy-coupling factor ABC transporter ATP-binding protein [Spirochaetaceae bacterium]|jgi:cobalt/nickel transport system ATP-binding protein|nr:energy-coupling factor ABC transporter ATP-binding protein [Spirochaetaceae bacterium]